MPEDEVKNNDGVGQDHKRPKLVSSGMIDISSFLKKFKKILLSGEEERKIVSEEIAKVAFVDIPPESIILKGGTAFINAKPAAKSEIFMNKGKILRGIIERGILSVRELR